MNRRGLTTTQIVLIVAGSVVLGIMLLAIVLGLLAGLMLPALSQARESAQGVMSGSQLRQINFAYQIWRQDPNRVEPFSFEMLVEQQYATEELFQSPFGPAPEGEDYWFLHNRPELPEADQARLIVGYDRAMYADRRRVAVMFGDGNMEVLGLADFERRIGSPPNDGIDFNLPRRRQE